MAAERGKSGKNGKLKCFLLVGFFEGGLKEKNIIIDNW